MLDLDELIKALRIANYTRVAVQVHDSQLTIAPDLIAELQKALPDSNVSLLGDSVTECCLDEVSAEHYGSDCIVKLGHSCWFASQRMVAYFIAGDSASDEQLFSSFLSLRSENPEGPVVLFVDSIQDVSAIQRLDSSVINSVYVCISPCLSYPGSDVPPVNWFTRRPFASMALALISRAFQARLPIIPRIAGRMVFRLADLSCPQVLDAREVSDIVSRESTSFIVNRVGSLFGRIVNRFGTRQGRVISCPPSVNTATSNYKELLRRYRGVESVKNASVVGIVVTHCAASTELFKVRDLLCLFLRAANKEVHMFSLGKPDGVKLGNFPEIDCFVVMSCPETDYFESSDLMADCVSPFEALVAVESLDWSDHVITDYDEMLARMVTDPPPRTPRTPRRSRQPKHGDTEFVSATKLAPAKIEMGLRGIPSRYVSEPQAPRS